MAFRFRFALASLTLLVFLTACGGGSGGGTPAFSYSGEWSGTISDSLAGSGTVTLTIVQSGSNVAGTWQATFAGGSNSGNLVGIVDSTQAIFELNPSDPTACPYDVVATRSGSTMTGTYAAFNCTISISGTLSVTKQ
jgi:hypothetical protein